MSKRLTKQQIADIQFLRISGWSSAALAEEFGVNITTIRYWTEPRRRQKVIDKSRDRYHANAEQIKERLRHRWQTDPEYRARRLRSMAESYRKKRGLTVPRDID